MWLAYANRSASLQETRRNPRTHLAEWRKSFPRYELPSGPDKISWIKRLFFRIREVSSAGKFFFPKAEEDLSEVMGFFFRLEEYDLQEQVLGLRPRKRGWEKR